MYSIVDGKMKEFRAEGGIVKTEDEKRQMAEKHRFKKNRDFKKRLEEDEENESADIRSFKFLSMERRKQLDSRKPSFGTRRPGRDDSKEFGEKKEGRRPARDGGKRFGGKPFSKGGRFDKEGKGFNKNKINNED